MSDILNLFVHTNNPNRNIAAKLFVHRGEEIRVETDQPWIAGDAKDEFSALKRVFNPRPPGHDVCWHIVDRNKRLIRLVHFFLINFDL